MRRDIVWSTRISAQWIEGLPIGNGRIGTMVIGCPGRERLALNHDDLWERLVERKTVPVAQHLAAVRHLCVHGDWEGAQKLLMEKLQPTPAHPDLSVEEYQAAGDLGISIELPEPVTRYRRSLDLRTGIAEVDFAFGDNRQRRRYCASAEDGLIAVGIANERPGSLGCDIILTTRTRDEWKVCAVPPEGADVYGFVVRSISGWGFSMACRVLFQGGEARFEEKKAQVRGADAVTVLVSVVSDREYPSAWEEAFRRVTTPKSVEQIIQCAVRDHRAYYDRVDLRLDGIRSATPSADTLVDGTMGDSASPRLFELMFKVARYLMISSSRPGTNPINLQGIWNDDPHPPWQSDWHLDVNLEMCYWLAESCNLSECTEPLFDWIERTLPAGRRNASDLFDCRGIFLPIACSRDAVALPGWWVAWPGAAAWLAQHFWQHYEFTGDLVFLRDRAYPYFKEVLSFYEDYLVQDVDGTLMVVPSLSPENIPANRNEWVCKNAVSDIAMISEVLRNAIRSGELLGVDADRVARWKAIRTKLPPWPLNIEGMLKEWADPTADDNPSHRHFSHLYPLYPSDLITREETPELATAAARALSARESHGYRDMAGWSYPNLAALHARLGQGNQALRCLKHLAQSCLMNNLLTTHNDWRFQGLSLFWDHMNASRLLMVDAILGTGAAVSEMLLQSHCGILRILPALPDAWPEGRVTGLRARDGFEVDIWWSAGRAIKVHIKSLFGRPCRVSLRPRTEDYQLASGNQPANEIRNPQGDLCFETTRGGDYFIVGNRANGMTVA